MVTYPKRRVYIRTSQSTMADKFQLDSHGNCSTCGNLSIESEHVKCFYCSKLFHVVCSGSTSEEKVATKTTITNFLNASTKKNFQFFCDTCLTSLEISKADVDSERINLLESKMNTIDSRLEEICSMLKSKPAKLPEAPAKPRVPPEVKSIWNDTDKLSSVKAPPSAAVLVVPKIPDQRAQDENKMIIEKTVVENHISLKETFTNRTGDLVLVCESTEKRDELKTLVHNAKQDISMNTPKAKDHSITLVGLSREHSADEIKKLIVQQNSLIKRFAEANNLDEHLKVHSVKPTRNNKDNFQAFASVSQILREGFKKGKDKLIIGVSSCKIYDRTQTKRCNTCQKFGHFMANCPTPQSPNCGKCAGDHSTNDCSSTDRGCVNCKRNGAEFSSHSAFYHKCPSLLRFEELLQESKKTDHLNLNRQKHSTTA